MAESIAHFAARSARKLRAQHSVCALVAVFIQTNKHQDDLPQYFNTHYVHLPVAISDTQGVVSAALHGLRMIYREEFYYKKSGVILQGYLIPILLFSKIFLLMLIELNLMLCHP